MGMKQKKKIVQKKFQNGQPKAEQFPPKFHGLVPWLKELIDAKGIDVAQPIWLRDCPT
jgi:hypothetical protein